MIKRRTFGVLAAGAALAAPSIVRAQTVLKVGLIPSEDSRAMLAQSKDILDAVEKNSGLKVQGFVATDYNGVIEALRSKHLDIAYLGPFSYVLATTVTPVEAFVDRRDGQVGPHLLSQPDHRAEDERHHRPQRAEGQEFRLRRSRLDLGLRLSARRPDQGRHRSQA